jgi:branched-chain amino acid transport system permease protein
LPKGLISSKSVWLATGSFVVLLILPLLLSEYSVFLVNEVFIAALLAMSLNLVLGYGGMLQLHFAIFSGVGGYTLGVIVVKTELPVAIAFLAAPVVAGIVGLVVHWFMIKLRGIYFAALSVALGEVIWAVIFKWRDFTGGEDGLLGVVTPSWTHSINGGYYFALIIATICITIMYIITKSPFGRTLEAIRDSEQRAKAIGVNVRRHQLIICTIASAFAGISGMLLVSLNQAAGICMLEFHRSIEILIMPILGGMHVFMGPAFGALIMTLLLSFLPAYTVYNLSILGGTLLVFVLFIPEGLLGYPHVFSKATVNVKGVVNVLTGRSNR